MQQRTSVVRVRDLEQVVALLLHLVFGIRVEKNQNHCHEPRNRSKHQKPTSDCGAAALSQTVLGGTAPIAHLRLRDVLYPLFGFGNRYCIRGS